MPTELYKKHRPKRLQDLVGQDVAVKSLGKFLASSKMPHALLLTGPSGCGKTTIARILKTHLKCSNQDFFERNSADFRGIEDVRSIRRHIDLRPIGGQCRIWLIDEAHKLTSEAQNALLKMLEDTPSHVYIILATTDPTKLLPTILTRCSRITVASIKEEPMRALLHDIIKKEGLEVPGKVLKSLIDLAEGSARKALVMLEQVGQLSDEEEQIKAIENFSFSRDASIDLARALIRRAPWAEVAKILRSIEEQDAEGIRYCVLGYARACMLGKKGESAPNPGFVGKAYLLVDLFSRNMYDSKHAGLAAACWEALNAK